MQAFKQNLVIGFGLSLLLLIVSSVASYLSINHLISTTEQVNHTNEVMTKLEGVISILKDAETGQRGFLLTNDESFLDPYRGAYNGALVQLNEVKQLTAENPDQQVDAEMLRNLVVKRLSILDALINQRRAGDTITTEALLEGKRYMDNARIIVKGMQEREKALLSQRTATQTRYALYTPMLILIAAALSVIVTVVSFGRVLTDYNKRVELQQELEDKDEEISKRLTIIRGIADTISAGDYKTRISDEGKDALGGIAGSLNRMAESLDHSFADLSDKEWLQTGIAKLNENMIGEKNTEVLANKMLEFISTYAKADIGAFYLMKDERTLFLASAIALDKNQLRSEVRLSEGIAGQAAASGKQIILNDISDNELVVNFSGGKIKPKVIVAVPVFYEGRLKGVCELGFLQSPTPITYDFLRLSVFNIGMAIHSARDHQRLQELLHETQAQSEELQAQHNELENINAELETQAEKLQASEEELRVQQEELQQANQELEERSRLLEEKNELVLERNLEIQAKAEDLALSTKYKSEFLANMSHELRTPLNSILLLSRLMAENQSGNLTKDQVEYAGVIQSSGNGLLRLIDEILDLSKIESGKMELEYNDVKLNSIVNDIRALFEPIAKDKGIDFSIEVKDAPEFIETDKLRVEQIIRNLISNALKFTRKGGVILTISKDRDAVAFTVKDTGIGIPKEKQQTIFEAFQQADGSTRRQFGGTGLG
ncbi:MAG: CHASE3 domain-containing protein, partial [Chitinophagaceae bacterium]